MPDPPFESEHDDVIGRAFDRPLARRLWASARAHRGLVWGSLALFPLVTLVELAQPYLIKVAIDDHILKSDWAGLAVVAPEAVLVVFGSQWVGTIIPLQILCIGGLFWSVTTLSDQIAHATAAVYHMFRRRIVLAVAIFLGALLGAKYGINGVAVAVAASQVMMYVVMARLALRLIHGDWAQFIACQMPGMLVTALITIGSHAVATLLRVNGWR